MHDEPTIFVVDGDAGSRDEIRNLIDIMNLRCELYASGQEFLDSYIDARPGCLVLELRVPGISGLEIQQRLVDQGSLLPVIFITARPDISIVVEAMRLGAVHFLEKPFRTHELWKAIQEALEWNRRQRELAAREQELKHRVASLTRKERQVLVMLGQGKANCEIASELGVCVRTVEIHRAKLIRKLQVSSLRELLEIGIPVSAGLKRQRSLQDARWLSE